MGHISASLLKKRVLYLFFIIKLSDSITICVVAYAGYLFISESLPLRYCILLLRIRERGRYVGSHL